MHTPIAVCNTQLGLEVVRPSVEHDISTLKIRYFDSTQQLFRFMVEI